ncbi:MAG TPA: hypothetical protein VIJ11_08200 [Galbitalea sp.]
MNCEVCGTELPHGALFCGECGRAVGIRTAKTLDPDSGMPVDSAAGSTPVVVAAPRDTAIIEPVVRATLPELETELPFLPEPAPATAPATATATTTTTTTTTTDEIEQDLAPEPPASSRPDPFPWGDRGSKIFSDSDELEQTLIVPRRDTGERFVLQFSTGESVTVFGSGLLGRNPTPQPSEYFDQLVNITDPGKSVSKTHLEFGQEAGSFWVSDRFSGNGSAVREPESAPRRLVAGKRYRIVRGTRVDIGEQFFVVS